MLPDVPKSDVLLVVVALGVAPMPVPALPPGTVDGVVSVVVCSVPADGAPEGIEDPSGGFQSEGGFPPAGIPPEGASPACMAGSAVDVGTIVLLFSSMADACGSIFTASMSVIPEVAFADTIDESMVIIGLVFVSRPDVADKIPWPK
jgi:hypothetical protein